MLSPEISPNKHNGLRQQMTVENLGWLPEGVGHLMRRVRQRGVGFGVVGTCCWVLEDTAMNSVSTRFR